MAYLTNSGKMPKEALEKTVPATRVWAPRPRAVSTHGFPWTTAGQGARFDEILPEEVLAGVRTVQEDVGTEESPVSKQEDGNVFVP